MAMAIARALSQRRKQSAEAPLTWIHVGKDLVQDVGASSAAGARPVWLKPDGYDVEKAYSSEFYTSAFSEAQLEEKRAASKAAIEAAEATIGGIDQLPAAVAEIMAREER